MTDHRHHIQRPRRSHRTFPASSRQGWHRGARFRLSRSARTGFALGACLTLLFLLPFTISLAIKNRRLREQVGRLERLIEDPADTAAAAGTGVTAARAANGTVSVSGSAAARVPSETAFPEPGDSVRRQPLKPLPSSRVLRRLTERDLLELTNSLSLQPNGMRLRAGAPADGTWELDALAANLVQGFTLLANGQQQDAAFVFEGIGRVCPNWPFGGYYLALATGRRDEMERVASLFVALRELGRITPEGEIYHVLACLFLGRHSDAEHGLDAFRKRGSRSAKLMLGPLYAPVHLPRVIERDLMAIEGLPAIQRVESILQ